jgi:hypothetical protein
VEVNSMGFFDALKRVLTHQTDPHEDEEKRKKIRDAWGLEEEQVATEPAGAAPAIASAASAYDRDQWQKKLRKILDELPASQRQFQDLMTEAHALNLEPGWIAERQHEEFAFLIRRAVADRVVSEPEHQRIDLARKLIGLSEPDAEEMLKSITAEAEAFFGKPVREEA